MAFSDMQKSVKKTEEEAKRFFLDEHNILFNKSSVVIMQI